MKIVPLEVKLREEKGKGISRRLRREGKIPAIFYGGGIEPVMLTVDARELTKIVQREGANVILDLKIDGSDKENTALIKEIQRDPIKENLLHVDFQKIALDKEIEATVPVVVVGEAPGVKEGGVLQHTLWELEVRALPRNLPEHVEVDISGLGIGDSLKVSDLPKLEGVEVLTDEEEVVLSIVPPTELKEEELVAEEEVPEVVGEEKEVEEAKEEKKPEAKEEKEGKEEKKEE